MNAARILVVEDEAIVAMEIEERLASIGYQLAGSASRGEEAVTLADELRPDLVLMDIRLQGTMDGIDAAREILARFRIPVIFVTAYSEDSTLERAKLAEPYGYIIKPFDDRELKSSIEIALYKHAAQEEIRRLNRLYDVLSQVNQAIVRVQTREELFPTVCRLVVERGAIDLAWIGMLDAERSRLVRVAHVANHADAPKEIDLVAEGSPSGPKNPWQTLLEGNSFVCTGCKKDDCLCPLGKSSSPLGFLSCGSFPLRFQGEVCGALVLHATEPGFLRDRETALLEEVAFDISFALDKIEGDAQRVRMERSLRASEQRYRKLFQEATDGIALADAATGEILDCNRAMAEMTGYDCSELIGKPQTILHPPEVGNPTVSSCFTRHRNDKEGQILATEIITRSGEVKSVEVKANRLEIDGRKVLQGFFRDVTGETRHQHERETTLRLLRLLNEPGSTMDMIRDLTGFLQEWSGCEAVGVRLHDGKDFPYFETRGFSPEFVQAEKFLCARDDFGSPILDGQGNPVLDCMCGNILCERFDPALPFFTSRGSFWTNSTTDLLASTTETDRQARTRNRCHGEGYESVALIPLRYGQTTLGLLQMNDRARNRFTPELIAFLEKTADQVAIALSQRQAQAKLQVSEQRFRDIRDATGEYIWETDPTGRLSYLSERVEAILEYRPDELLGRRPFDLMHDSDAAKLLAEFQEKAQRKEGFRDLEHRAFTKSGRPVWISATGIPILDATGELVGYRGASRDITERKASEETLRELHSELEQLLEVATPLCFIDKNHTLTRVNESFCSLFALKREEVLGRLCHEVWQGPLCGGPGCALDQVLAGAVECDYELERKLPDGRAITVLVMAKPFLDGAGEVRGLIESFVDITERKRAEQEKIKLESQLRHAQKLEAIGTLAGGIAHDFNNILTPIIGYTEMALSDTPESSSMRYDLTQVLTAANRAKDLVKQILTFSRLNQDQLMRPTDLSLVLKEALKLLRASLPTTIEIRKNIHRAVILGDATQIHQVIVNLCTNAAHAMSERGVLHVSLTQVSLGDNDLCGLSFGDLSPGTYVKLTISDTGHGMSPEILEHIFDPYFTTKKVGEGTGLGLAVVHGIVKKHGGEIRVQSTPGEGSVFDVYLPAITAETARTPEGFLSLPRGTESILLVDDEPMIMDMSSRLLGQLGYSVKAKTDPRDALSLLLANPNAIDLLITDYTMPHLTGIDLAHEARKVRPGLPILLCTGFSERVTPKMAERAGITEVLTKPFQKARLAEVVRKVLDAGKR